MTFCSVYMWKREWRTCMCVCSLICCSVAIVTTLPISLLIQTGLKLCLVAVLPTSTPLPSSQTWTRSFIPPPHAHAQPAVWAKHLPLSLLFLSCPSLTLSSHLINSIHSSQSVTSSQMIEWWRLVWYLVASLVFSTLSLVTDYIKTDPNLEWCYLTSTNLAPLNPICRSQRPNTSFL